VARLVPATSPTERRGDRLETLRDANYFAGELLRRLEQLTNSDAQPGHWHQAAKLVSRVQDLVRYWALQEAKRRREHATSSAVRRATSRPPTRQRARQAATNPTFPIEPRQAPRGRRGRAAWSPPPASASH